MATGRYMKKAGLRVAVPVLKMKTSVTTLRGVNLNGAEFGAGANSALGTGGTFSNTNPGTHGTDYIHGKAQDWAYLKTRGIKLVRYLFRWERVQPALGGALDATELGRITTAIDDAAANGIKLVVTPKNEGAYWRNDGDSVGTRHWIGDGTVTRAHFVDFWSRMSAALASRSANIVYGLMNEPLLSGAFTATEAAVWEGHAQAAFDAIRLNDANTVVSVPLYGYNINKNSPTSDSRAVTYHPAGPWINGSKVWYEGHNYGFITSETDTYIAARDKAVTDGWTAGSNTDALHSREIDEIDAFAAWLGTAKGFMGEIGVRNDDAAWLALLDVMLGRCDAHKFHATAWAAGWFWDNAEPFLIYTNTSGITYLDSTTASAATVEKHL